MFDLLGTRRIAKPDINTPLLVPSFSSTARSDIGAVHALMRQFLGRCSLVSAYDISYGAIDADKIWASDLVFLDSGNYEFRRFRGASEERPWSLNMYEDVLEEIGQPTSGVVIVNYDRPSNVDLQLSDARDLFRRHLDSTNDFLYKPINKAEPYVSINHLIGKLNHLDGFDILGITEKELGKTELEKCRNLIRIRKALSQAGLELPIHIFGCLDPVLVIIYLVCGADIFDGTAWLWRDLSKDLSNYLDLNLLGVNLSESRPGSSASMFVNNLNLLSHLQLRLQRFADSHDLALLALTAKTSSNLKNLIVSAAKPA